MFMQIAYRSSYIIARKSTDHIKDSTLKYMKLRTFDEVDV